MRYPTRNGIPVHPSEVGLAPSRLTPVEHHLTNHHMEWPHSRQLASVAMWGLVNVESMQVILPKDQHNYGKLALHSIFEPPEMPTQSQATDYLLEAFEAGDAFKIYDLDEHRYIRKPMTEDFINKVLQEKYRGV